ncbi:RNA polymerase sigma factor [Spirosoma koreense]
MSVHLTEERLVLALRQGDSKAFQQLYTRYNQALFVSIIQLIKDPAEAEDLLQDAYVKAWQRFSSYDSQQGSLYTWLYNIARHTALDALRKRKLALQPLSPEAEAVSILTDVEQDPTDFHTLVRQQLPATYWQVLDLAYWQGYTQKEIAVRLGLALGTVKTRHRQSLISLRPLFRIQPASELA